MIHITRRLTAKNRDQLQYPTFGNRVWATFIFLLWFDHGFILQLQTVFARPLYAAKGLFTALRLNWTEQVDPVYTTRSLVTHASVTTTRWVKKVSCCTVIYQRLDNCPNVKYSTILWTVQDLKVGNTNSICVAKYSILQTFISLVISLTVFSHGIFRP